MECIQKINCKSSFRAVPTYDKYDDKFWMIDEASTLERA